MNSFYITLPSNAEEGCKTGDFFVRLPQSIAFSDNYEVGLCELSYPHTWNTLQSVHEEDSDLLDNQFRIRLIDGVRAICTVPPAYYATVHDLFYGMSRELRTKVDKLAERMKLSLAIATKKKHIKFATRVHSQHPRIILAKELKTMKGQLMSFDDLTKRVVLKKPNGIETIELSRKLQYMLGFKETLLKEKVNTASGPVDLSAGMTHLYVYSSIVSPQIVGNVMAPLLRVVRSEGHSGETVEKVFMSPHYMPVSVKECNRIDITVCSDSGIPIPFQYGKVIVKLHFRRKSIF